MNHSEIIDIEKAHFSNFHSNFSKFMKKINTSENLDTYTLKNIIILNKKFLEINNILESINYNKNNDNIDKIIKKYNKNDKAINKFLPYIIYYRMMID